MNEARNNILNRLRDGRVEASVEMVEPEALPDWDASARRRRFIDRLEAVRAEVAVSTAEQLSALLARWLEEHAIKTLVSASASPWHGALVAACDELEQRPRLAAFKQPIEQCKDSLFDRVDAAITTATGAIAETGTLLLQPTPDEPRSLSLVPPIHIAIVEERTLYNTLAEAIDAQQWQQGMPTNLVLVSGPSKSADIARTLAYGVHGPKALLVALITEESQNEAGVDKDECENL